MSQESTAHRESPQGFAIEAANEDELRAALEKAFDYRGDVTILLKDGTKLECYIFDRLLRARYPRRPQREARDRLH
jgi:hypothetical protein